MMQDQIRPIKRIITGSNAIDGASVKLVRVFGHRNTKEMDPFLMLDAFDSTDPDDYVRGFPWHPHRGIETITYLIKGNIEHSDSLGNKGNIRDGDCQWMTAGSGIIHQEMPKAADRMLGVQLWLNLPAKDKMTAPRYNGIVNDDIPLIDEGDRKIRILAGTYDGKPGAAQGDFVKLLYLDVEMEPGALWSMETDADSTLFIYILQGAGVFGPDGDEVIAEKHAVLFDEGQLFKARAAETGTRFLLLAGKPLREPIEWGGPIVMNTKEELDLAFRELDENKFIK